MSESLSQWLKSLVAVVVGLGVSLAVISGISRFASELSGDFNDFDFSDLYMRVGERNSVACLSEDVVIVSVDGCSRTGIRQVIEAVDFFSPAAVGLDIFFLYQSEDGDALAQSLSCCDNLVLPLAVGRDFSGSYFYDALDAEYGVVNILSSSAYDVVRDYVTVYQTDTAEYVSMPVALVRKAGFTDVEVSSEQRGIWYPSVEFDIIKADEIVDDDGVPHFSCADRIKGKIVLIGDVKDVGDMHRTPIDEEMPGIMIQAHIIDTLINDRHVNEVGVFWCLFIAFIVCLLYTRLQIHMKEKWDDVGEMFMSIMQFVLIYIFFVLGVNLYLRRGLFIDFSVTMMMLFLSLSVLSLINGLNYIWNKIRKI